MIDSQWILRETFVEHVEYHDELPSTNDLAAQRAAEEAPCTRLIIAGRQTAGRGRGENRWWSGDGALTFSLLFDTAAMGLEVRHWPQLSLTAGLAVYETLVDVASREAVGLKWPNDVFLHERKVCGILVEAPPHPKPHLVVGIGINVNNATAHAPSELREAAIALCEAADEPLDPGVVLIDVLKQLESQFARVNQRDASLSADWRAACLLSGRQVCLASGERQVSGKCQGIDHDGALLIETPAGIERFFGGRIERFW